MEHKRDAMWRRERMAREAHDRRMYREEERMVRQIERGIARDVIRGVDNMIHGGPREGAWTSPRSWQSARTSPPPWTSSPPPAVRCVVEFVGYALFF